MVTDTHDVSESETGTEPGRVCPDASWTDENGERLYCMCVQPRHGGTDVACCANNIPHGCLWQGSDDEGGPLSWWSDAGGECWPEGLDSIDPRYANPCPWVDDPID